MNSLKQGLKLEIRRRRESSLLHIREGDSLKVGTIGGSAMD